MNNFVSLDDKEAKDAFNDIRKRKSISDEIFDFVTGIINLEQFNSEEEKLFFRDQAILDFFCIHNIAMICYVDPKQRNDFLNRKLEYIKAAIENKIEACNEI